MINANTQHAGRRIARKCTRFRLPRASLGARAIVLAELSILKKASLFATGSNQQVCFRDTISYSAKMNSADCQAALASDRRRAEWTERVERYARDAAPRTRPFAVALVELLPPPVGARVLDVATGTGLVAVEACLLYTSDAADE